MSKPSDVGDDECDRDFKDMPAGPFNGRVRRHLVLDSIPHLVRFVVSQPPITAWVSFALQSVACVSILR